MSKAEIEVIQKEIGKNKERPSKDPSFGLNRVIEKHHSLITQLNEKIDILHKFFLAEPSAEDEAFWKERRDSFPLH